MTEIERLIAAMQDPDVVAQVQADIQTLADDIESHGFGMIPLADGSIVTVDYTELSDPPGRKSP